MSPFPAPRPLLLEPLEDFPLVVPFPERHLLPSGPGVLGLFNETPSTIDLSLPTPNIPILTMFDDDPPPATQAHYDTDMPQAEIIQPPPAPVIKDMDSFSEGTAQGSFDFSMCSDNGDAPALQPSVAFSPDHPTLSIEVWRDDVDRSTVVDREERRTRSDDRGRIFEEPAAKRRRLSMLPTPREEERPVAGSAVGRSQSLPPISFCLIRDDDDCNNSVALLSAAVPRPPSAPPALT